MTAVPNTPRSPVRIRLSLMAIFFVVCALAAGRFWQMEQRSRWLEKATIDELAAAATRNEQDVAVFERLGVRAREQQQWARAARAFQHAVELAPDRVSNWVGWARTIYEIDGYRSANLILSEYVRTHPDEARAYIERASLRRTAQRRDAALEDAIKATELAPESGEAWALRGDLLLDSGLPGEAESAFKRARERMPASAWPLVGLYQTHTQAYQYPQALAIAREIVKRFPGMTEGYLYLAEAITETAEGPDDYAKVRAALQKAAPQHDNLRPLDQFAYDFLMGRSYYEERRYREALPFLESAYRKVGDNPDMLFALGRTYRALGDEKMAQRILKEHRQTYDNIASVRRLRAKIEDDPTDPAPRLELARWYTRKGVLGSAAIQYEDMIEHGIAVETAQTELKALEARRANP